MTTLTIARPAHEPPSTATTAELREVLRAAAHVVAAIDLDDPAWADVGPELTELVNRTRAAAAALGTIPSRRPLVCHGEHVAPVLRLRDLAHLRRQLRDAARGTADDRSVPSRDRSGRRMRVSAAG